MSLENFTSRLYRSPIASRVAPVGEVSVRYALVFVVTLSFMFTTPGVIAPEAGGFPVLALVGNFLVKDVVLLAVPLWTLGDSVRTLRSEPLRSTTACVIAMPGVRTETLGSETTCKYCQRVVDRILVYRKRPFHPAASTRSR